MPSEKKPWPWEARNAPGDAAQKREVDRLREETRARDAAGSEPTRGEWWRPGPVAAFAIGVAMTIGVLIVSAVLIGIFYDDPGRVTVLHETAIGTWLTAGGVWGLLLVTAWRRS